eukprot:Nitzschia sp. Nitz4//scaffold23_size168460//85662//86494//NITZ4_002221-RA/size168460-snap-gene-0.103-mRNA-1//1//CDS//3329543641//5944//frame0
MSHIQYTIQQQHKMAFSTFVLRHSRIPFNNLRIASPSLNKGVGVWKGGRWLSSPSQLEEISQYLTNVCGVEDVNVQNGIVKAMESVYGKDVRVSHLEAFGKEGIGALAASVQTQVKKRQGFSKRPAVSLKVVIPHHQTEFDVNWRLGESLLDVAKNNEEIFGEYMEGTCGGNMSCCTCHIYVDQPEFQEFLDPPLDAELDMLDLAYDPEDSSRLGCQIRLTEKMMMESSTKLEIRIPAGVNNVWN